MRGYDLVAARWRGGGVMHSIFLTNQHPVERGADRRPGCPVAVGFAFLRRGERWIDRRSVGCALVPSEFPCTRLNPLVEVVFAALPLLEIADVATRLIAEVAARLPLIHLARKTLTPRIAVGHRRTDPLGSLLVRLAPTQRQNQHHQNPPHVVLPRFINRQSGHGLCAGATSVAA